MVPFLEFPLYFLTLYISKKNSVKYDQVNLAPGQAVCLVETWGVAHSSGKEFQYRYDCSSFSFKSTADFQGQSLRTRGWIWFLSSHPAWLCPLMLCKERVKSLIQIHLAFTLPNFATGVTHASSSSSWWAHLAQCANWLSLLFSSCSP